VLTEAASPPWPRHWSWAACWTTGPRVWMRLPDRQRLHRSLSVASSYRKKSQVAVGYRNWALGHPISSLCHRLSRVDPADCARVAARAMSAALLLSRGEGGSAAARTRQTRLTVAARRLRARYQRPCVLQAAAAGVVTLGGSAVAVANTALHFAQRPAPAANFARSPANTFRTCASDFSSPPVADSGV
jgi:hypothetical protein